MLTETRYQRFPNDLMPNFQVVRRKLDDITKKLSLLYDLLRESRVWQTIV